MRTVLVFLIFLFSSSAFASDAFPDDLLVSIFDRIKNSECQQKKGCELKTSNNDRISLLPLNKAPGHILYEATYITSFCGSSGCYGAVLERQKERVIVVDEVQGVTPEWTAKVVQKLTQRRQLINPFNKQKIADLLDRKIPHPSSSGPKTTANGPDIMGVRIGDRIGALPPDISRLQFKRIGEHYELSACSNDEVVRRSIPALSNIKLDGMGMAAACLHIFAIGDVGPNARAIYAMQLHNYPLGDFQFMQAATNVLTGRYGSPTARVVGDRSALLAWGISEEALRRIEFQTMRAAPNGYIFNTDNAFKISGARRIHAASLSKSGFAGTWGPATDPVRANILVVDQHMFEEANKILMNNSTQQKHRALQEELQRSKSQKPRF